MKPGPKCNRNLKMCNLFTSQYIVLKSAARVVLSSSCLWLMEVFKSAECDPLTLIQSEQSGFPEYVELVLPVTGLRKVVRALPAAPLSRQAGVPGVDHEFGSYRVICGTSAVSRLSGQGVAQRPLQVGDGHVRAHGGQSQVNIRPSVTKDI